MIHRTVHHRLSTNSGHT